MLLTYCHPAVGQSDTTHHPNLKFTGDFRFRIEHDWNSRNQNGIKRADRSRLRYRFRFGVHFSIDGHSSFGGRIRSGNLNDQQGPHVTLGGDPGEFGLVRVGFEKLFYQFVQKGITAWVGKNSIPLKKLNELFWNDNVYPEGIALKFYPQWLSKNPKHPAGIHIGHFIVNSRNRTFPKDSYLQIIQLTGGFLEGRLNLFPGFYRFKNIGNYPDGKQTFEMDYSILHLGSQVILGRNDQARIGLEFYQNLEDYSAHDSIPEPLKKETSGFVLSAEYGKLKKKRDWLFSLSYANIQKFSIVDYFAQNDWSRWDYGHIGAAGSRISNFQGFEIKIAYAIAKNFNLNLRAYHVEQLKKIGSFKENGNRIRLDLNIGF